nr:MAG TPA: hypothetical protein [Caudoviricetes sp.]
MHRLVVIRFESGIFSNKDIITQRMAVRLPGI